MENRAHIHDVKTMDLPTAKCQLFPKIWVCLNLLKYWQNQKMQLNSWRTTQFGWNFSKVSNMRNFSSYERKKTPSIAMWTSRLQNHGATSSSYNKYSLSVLFSKRGSFETCPLASLPKFIFAERGGIHLSIIFPWKQSSLLSSER